MTYVLRLLLLLLGAITTGPRNQRPAVPPVAGDGGPAVEVGGRTVEVGGRTVADGRWDREAGGAAWHLQRPGATHRARPSRRRVAWAVAAVAIALIFRKAIAALALMSLTAALHLVGIDAVLPHVQFAWPWQGARTGPVTNTDVGPLVLEKIEGLARPTFSQASFDFVFTHRVSRNIGPWPCWYAETFYAIARASATVTLNPGPAWWAPGTGHYRLQVLSRPRGGRPGSVDVTIALPAPELPRTAHDVAVDNIGSRPIDTQHSWTYPGLGCGLLLRPQFSEAVLYAQAQQIAFYKATRLPGITRPLITQAEMSASRTIRGGLLQPALNALGYQIGRFTIHWV